MNPNIVADDPKLQRKSSRDLDSDGEAELAGPRSKVQTQKVNIETASRIIKYSLFAGEDKQRKRSCRQTSAKTEKCTKPDV